jgi:hypothetical protein
MTAVAMRFPVFGATFFLLALGAVISPSVGTSQSRSSPSSSAERALINLENGWARGLVRRDRAMFRRLLASDFVYTENAEVMGAKEVIASVTGSDTVTWAGNEGMKVYLHGTTGIVTGILAMRGRGKGGEFNKRYRFTDTWKYLGGRWQIIAAQDYLIPK